MIPPDTSKTAAYSCLKTRECAAELFKDTLRDYIHCITSSINTMQSAAWPKKRNGHRQPFLIIH